MVPNISTYIYLYVPAITLNNASHNGTALKEIDDILGGNAGHTGGRFAGGGGVMGCHNDIGHREQGAGGVQRLGLGHVQTGGFQLFNTDWVDDLG